jgi:RsmE family RNA methyltransferase
MREFLERGGGEGSSTGAEIPSAEADPARDVPLAEASPTESAATGRARGVTLLVGPEGGWSEGEVAWMGERGLTAVTLGATILRVETAAIAAAAVVGALSA